MFSQARQINGCDNIVEEAVVGTLGKSNCKNLVRPKSGSSWRFRGEEGNPYRQEHEDLIASIRTGKPINEAQAIAESTMTGIIGREARLQWSGGRLGGRHEIGKAARPGELHVRPLSDPRGRDAGPVSLPLITLDRNRSDYNLVFHFGKPLVVDYAQAQVGPHGQADAHAMAAGCAPRTVDGPSGGVIRARIAIPSRPIRSSSLPTKTTIASTLFARPP